MNYVFADGMNFWVVDRNFNRVAKFTNFSEAQNYANSLNFQSKGLNTNFQGNFGNNGFANYLPSSFPNIQKNLLDSPYGNESRNLPVSYGNITINCSPNPQSTPIAFGQQPFVQPKQFGGFAPQQMPFLQQPLNPVQFNQEIPKQKDLDSEQKENDYVESNTNKKSKKAKASFDDSDDTLNLESLDDEFVVKQEKKLNKRKKEVTDTNDWIVEETIEPSSAGELRLSKRDIDNFLEKMKS
ncbi:hypothetical protein [Spiroplasma apis]|uniref:Uncharacterized protein n=1 Tax=Spiroplasma apis B31 TaxID=1276258 RepID=V5RKC9_SPIAP|nr:hypothetical protein [Spiroplasma apis]AHB36265.1 hypothetical protein SAPIS_v1c04190 [Spiroplasma apis B31]